MSGAVVRHSVLGPDARVGRRAKVTGQSLIGRGQVVGDDARVDGARIPDEG
jgi:acetyltransferase-like isoleucine patch superfamily enzyme